MSKLPISEEDYEKVEAYLDGRMTDAEREAFELEMEGNPRLKSAFDDYRMLIAALAQAEGERFMREMMGKWAGESAEMKEDASDTQENRGTSPSRPGSGPMRRKPRLGRWKLVIPAAAALALATWVGIRHFSPRKDTDLFVKYFQSDPRAPYNLGPSEADEGRLAMGAYLHGDYKDADRRFGIAREKAPADDTLRYFHAITQLAMGKPTEAKLSLEPLCAKPSGFQEMARWYNALAIMEISGNEAALTELQAIQSESSHPMQQQAAELVKEILAQ